ncbi:hypothetical protein BAOM_4890 [Peribacillus asahii]|uniref:Uncharacterized protein n=1 Tax=Peribacillus asahii TaxID=228899 RepID=A0A3Q9RMX8_9BACI|nr:hypothetical protein BAOM_4890 [Peribacillus asahii]
MDMLLALSNHNNTAVLMKKNSRVAMKSSLSRLSRCRSGNKQ